MNVMLFIESGRIEINCDSANLKDSFENLYSKPNHVNKYVHGSTNEHDLSENGVCVVCLIVKIVGETSRNLDMIQEDSTTCKKSKTECNNCFTFMFECQDCAKEEVLRNELIEIVNHFFEDIADLQIALRCNIRKLIPKNVKRFSPTYELTLQVTKLTHIFLLIIPIGVKDDPTLLFYKSYGFVFDKRHQTLYAKTLKSFENDAPSHSLVASKQWLIESVLPKLKKWGESSNTHKSNDYKSLVDVEKYSSLYFNLKEKYAAYLINVWTENTDPLKFVYEDIGIATYLLLLWEEERVKKNLRQKQSFIDLGCGNGLLVYILTKEGHPGTGVDIVKRKIWNVYGDGVCLEETSILPQNLKVDVDWIIGNHTDELTPWIPIIAARSSYTVNYFVLPCCFYDFNKKFDGGSANSESKYRNYLNYVVKIGIECGFNVEEDILKIPSTKRICSIGRERTFTIDDHANIDNVVKDVLKNNSCSVSLDEQTGFSPREVNKDPKNCTQIDHRVKEKMIDQIIERLLSKENFDYKNDKQELTSSGVKLNEWNAGDILTISECAELFNKELLRKLKDQSGGLQSLLRNNQRIFKVFGGKVALRDFRNAEEMSWGRKSSVKKSDNRKTAACWFFMCHPQGCVLTAEKCHYAHGEKDKREFTLA